VLVQATALPSTPSQRANFLSLLPRRGWPLPARRKALSPDGPSPPSGGAGGGAPYMRNETALYASTLMDRPPVPAPAPVVAEEVKSEVRALHEWSWGWLALERRVRRGVRAILRGRGVL
jgi:hypothetical protein